MTTPPPPTVPGGHTPHRSSGPGRSFAIPVRPLTVWTLLALVGAILVFRFLTWIFPPHPGDFLDRFQVDRFIQIAVLVGPLLAVLIATRLGPPLGDSRRVGVIALVEYAVALLLEVFAFLLTLATRFDGLDSGIYAFGGVLAGLGGIVIDLLLLALLALAGLWTYQIFTGLGGRLPRFSVRTS